MERLVVIALAAILGFAGLYGVDRVGCLAAADHHQFHHGITVQACTRDRFAGRLAPVERWLEGAPRVALARL